MAAPRDQSFVFSPADLAEDVDLSVEQKKEILFLSERLRALDHWQVLGVRWNAPAGEVRAAYLEKAKIFHPDRHAGRRLGSYLGRIEKIFRALTEARDVLSDEALRAEYARRTAPPEEFARIEARKLSEEARAEERRARLTRANPLLARANRVQELVVRGKRAMADGRYSQAANDFLTAVGMDPRHAQARALAEEARKKALSARASELYEQALAAEAVGQQAVALSGFREAAEADPSVPRYAVAASRLALLAGDADDARTLADRAVRAGPRDARAFEALGAALVAQGLAREARAALDRALALDATLDEAKALLKKTRWSFLR